MTRTRLAPIAAVALAIALAAPAAEAKRTVPFGFHSANYGSEILDAPTAVQDAEWARMARNGVESARVSFYWTKAQPQPGPIDFTAIDRIVSQAATHGVRVLPVVVNTPEWARIDPAKGGSPPRNVSDYTAYLDALIARYGPNGALWRERPDLPRRFVREWQIWNEPHLRDYWDVPNWESSYHKLLRASYKLLKQRDPGATVVFGGITRAPWDILEDYYDKRGGKRAYDVMAIHPYTRFPKGVPTIVRRSREVMNENGDKNVPLWITEFGWSASKGKVSAPKSIAGIQVTDDGLAKNLTSAYDKLVAARKEKSTRVERAYWFTWASEYNPNTGNQLVSIFGFSGLTRYTPSTTSIEEKPALAAYRRSAQRYQGCSKTDAGRCK